MLEEKIISLIEPSLKSQGLSVVQAKVTGNNKGKLLQIFLENLDGSTPQMENIEKASRNISVLLDVENVFADRYYLEVSSAGLDRVLLKKKDFERFIGFLVNIKLRLKNELGTKRLRGRITKVTEENFSIFEEEKKLDVTIDFHNLDEARVVLTDELLKSKGAKN
jgi:ribosome maturation factor RimP